MRSITKKYFLYIAKAKLNRLISIIDTPLAGDLLQYFYFLDSIIFEPYYYGDEMIYLALGEGIRQGIPLYLGLHDNKPHPLFNCSCRQLICFQGNFSFWNLITVYGFWKLVKHLFPHSTNFKTSLQLFWTINNASTLRREYCKRRTLYGSSIIFAFGYYFQNKTILKFNHFWNIVFYGALYKIPAPLIF